MSLPDPKPKSGYDALPMMQTPSGRLVYDPDRASEVAVDTAALGDRMREMTAIENADARTAVPEPREAKAAADGALVAAGEDAARAHAEVIVAPHVVPSLPSAPVRIKEVLDPRKTKTQRMAPVTVEEPPPSSAPPSMSASARRPRSGAGWRERRWVAVPLGAALLAVLVALMLRGPGGPRTGTSGNDVGSPSVTASAPVVGSAGASEAATTSASAAASAGATSSAAATTSAVSVAPVPSGAPSASVKVTPSVSSDPYADAGVAPAASSAPSVEPSSVPAAPSVTPSSGPAATAAPSVTPSRAPTATAAPSTLPSVSPTTPPAPKPSVVPTARPVEGEREFGR